MGVAKYSPTVSNWYRADQQWWEKNGGGQTDINYDKDGYDSYGYDKDGRDRAGHLEEDYYDGEWFTDSEGNDVYEYTLVESVYYSWDKPVPTL